MVAKAVGFLDVWGDIFVWTREDVDDWLAQFCVALGCEIDGFGSVWVLLECGDAVADDWVGVEVLRALSVGCSGLCLVRRRGSYLRRGRQMMALRYR